MECKKRYGISIIIYLALLLIIDGGIIFWGKDVIFRSDNKMLTAVICTIICNAFLSVWLSSANKHMELHVIAVDLAIPLMILHTVTIFKVNVMMIVIELAVWLIMCIVSIAHWHKSGKDKVSIAALALNMKTELLLLMFTTNQLIMIMPQNQ